MCNERVRAQRTLGEGLQWPGDVGQEVPWLDGPSRLQDAAMLGLETPIRVQLCPSPPCPLEMVSPSQGRHRWNRALLRNTLGHSGVLTKWGENPSFGHSSVSYGGSGLGMGDGCCCCCGPSLCPAQHLSGGGSQKHQVPSTSCL